ncbi:beta-galactosidase 8 [Actinidia rufa]|uniref:Beta-galactosidase n=1 Tax=Actinidia rufa TaxID=165716 RepID=A0A7J0GQQ8_9ERIC|nr:beta-galactosidase 8 [Actinidia rufa]
MLFILSLMALGVLATTSFGANITYDHRALLIDGQRRVLISGSIHYPRSTPDMWPDLIQKSKDGGLDVIETYVFWNLHEPVQNKYDFEGRKDLVKFIKLVAEAGLYAHLRIGPYVCAEWNYGGFPLWLHFIPGIKFRTDNEPFKVEMKRFTAKIVDMMKQENLYASQGGPIILSQIENEYGNIDSAYGSAAKTYINWAASMATSLDTGVPWVMCQQADAPDSMINTCNGFYCDQFTPNSAKKPKMWTENWTGWFLPFGGAVPYRPVEDIAFAVARFFQRGGTFQNYYMYHGGTNFGRTTGGPFIATSYDYDAPIDEYGLCAAFLANVDTQSDTTVNFNGNSYHLPAWSVSILPDCKNVVLNTAKINSVAIIPKFMHQSSEDDVDASEAFLSGWSWFNEPVGISSNNAFMKLGLLEQINTTADQSDYLWYSLRTDIHGNEPFFFKMDLKQFFMWNHLAMSFMLLLMGNLQCLEVSSGPCRHGTARKNLARARARSGHGSGKGNSGNAKVSIQVPTTLIPGKNRIDLLSLTVGLQNYGAFFDESGAGVTGPVKLQGVKNGSTIDLSSQQWTYQVGLKGEALGLSRGGSSVWISDPTLPKEQPLIWYKINFDAPSGSNPIALDFTGMGKGEAWVNGQSIGRYWPTYTAPSGGCTNSCNYRGPYKSDKCLKNCGKPSQQLSITIFVLVSLILKVPRASFVATTEWEYFGLVRGDGWGSDTNIICYKRGRKFVLSCFGVTPLNRWTCGIQIKRQEGEQGLCYRWNVLSLARSFRQSSLQALELLKGLVEALAMAGVAVPGFFQSYRRPALDRRVAALESRLTRLATHVLE